MINSFTSLDQLFGKLVRDLDLEEVPYHSLVEWTRTVLQTIGGGIQSGQYALWEVSLPVVDHLAELPGDFYCINEGAFFQPYKVVNNFLTVAQKDGVVTIPYLAFHTDEDGKLLYPDLPSYQDALRWYFLSMKALQGKASSPDMGWEACNARFVQKAGEARGDANMPTIHQIQQAATNGMNLRYDTNPLAHGFRNSGKAYQRNTFRGPTRGRY